MEKPLAAAAGLGWQGKHTNLVSRQFGSWLFLGAIFTTLDLPPDAPETDHCGNCRACLDVCPTGGFPGAVPARCAALHFLPDHRAQGPIPREFRALMGNRIYGCDDCLAVCPWNKFAVAGREAKLAAREALRAPRLADLVRLDDAAFRALVRKKPGQAHRPRALRPQCADRDRQFRRCQSRRARPSGCSTMNRRWCAAPRCGRSAGSIASGSTVREDARDNETDPDVIAEWTAACEARQ